MIDDLLRNRPPSSLASQLTLRAYLSTLSKKTLGNRLQRIGLPAALADDRAALAQELVRPERSRRVLKGLRPAALREAVERVVFEHGGIVEAKNIARLGIDVEDPARWRMALEESLLGTVFVGGTTDIGLRLGRGSLVVFLDTARGILKEQLPSASTEEPEPPADILADLSSVRTYLDHHSVRVTREGTLYRTTARKMRSSVLSPGARPMDAEVALDFLFRFLRDAELISQDSEGRVRVREDWSSFEERGPVERTELLLTYVVNDARGSKGEFHQPKLRRLLLNVLRDQGLTEWLDLKALTRIARNQYLMALDPTLVADRYQKRYKYVPIPPLVGPAGLLLELTRFATEGLALLGIVQVAEDERGNPVVRLTRLGALVLGIDIPDAEHGLGRPLVVTPDFEVVLFPDVGGLSLVHEVGLFARREKADYSLHYRISERSVQEAVAKGVSGDDILDILSRNARHEVPGNVVTSVRAWAEGVRVLNARRTWLLRAESEEALDALLRVRDIQAAAGERLNPLTVELLEDPSNVRVAEALRTHGFFLR